jgi:putative ABC transport system permease protein
MKYVPFVLKHLKRNWIRTTLTVLGMAACIFLFCTLRTVLQAMEDARTHGNVTRLVTRHAISLVYNVPAPYEGKIAQVPGVKRVAISTWFGGSLPAKKESTDKKGSSSGPDFSNFFPNMAVEEEPFFAMHPEYKVPPDQMRAFVENLKGCLVGRKLATKYGWKVGDTFHLESFIPPYRKKDGPFEFVISGIFDVDKAKEAMADDGIMYFHYKYLYESTGRLISPGLYVIELTDPSLAGQVSKAVDALFENSEAETKTESEAAFQADFLAMVGNLALLLNSIGLAVIFTILLVTANTMSMAVRERRTEIAVLKTLGFSSGRVMGLILGEAVTIGALGGAIGLALSAVVISSLPNMPGIGDIIRGFPDFGLHLKVSSQGVGMALGLALLAGLVPATVAYRSRISDMLRQV